MPTPLKPRSVAWSGAAIGFWHEIRSQSKISSAAAAEAKIAPEMELPEDKVIIGMVACLKPQKSPEDFIEIAARVLDQTDQAHFVMAGDGELRASVEERIRQYGIGGHITLLGWQNEQDMPEIYRNLDIVVLTSLWEGLPCVFSEAMACELPIVATNVDGAREAIIDGENGYLIPASRY